MDLINQNIAEESLQNGFSKVNITSTNVELTKRKKKKTEF